MSERLRKSIRQKLRPSIFTVSIKIINLLHSLELMLGWEPELFSFMISLESRPNKFIWNVTPKALFITMMIILQKSSECSDCMLVEIGEKTSYFGEPCEKCGKYPRTPYNLNY